MTKGSPVGDRRSSGDRRRAPPAPPGSPPARRSTTSTGTGALRPQAIDQLGAIDDDGEAPAGGGDDLLAQQGAAQPLDQIERAALHLIGAVDREIDLAMLGERRRAECPRPVAWAAVRSEVGMPTKRRPWRWRRASASTAKAAVEPVPSPTTMPSSTSFDRCLGRLRASARPDRHRVGVAALMTLPLPPWRSRGWRRWPPRNPWCRRSPSRRRSPWRRRPPPVPAVVSFSPPSTSITGSRPRSAQIARMRRILGSISGKERLAAESGIDRHHQNDVAEMQHIFDELRRARRDRAPRPPSCRARGSGSACDADGSSSRARPGPADDRPRPWRKPPR